MNNHGHEEIPATAILFNDRYIGTIYETPGGMIRCFGTCGITGWFYSPEIAIPWLIDRAKEKGLI